MQMRQRNADYLIGVGRRRRRMLKMPEILLAGETEPPQGFPIADFASLEFGNTCIVLPAGWLTNLLANTIRTN